MRMGISILLILLMSMNYKYVFAQKIKDSSPAIKFESISSESLSAWKEELKINIAYDDPDGDLGENIAEARNLFVVDNRNHVEYKFRIRTLSGKEEKIHIRGKLVVVMKKVPLLNENEKDETLRYIIYVKDRAGNISNKITTPEITVTVK